MKAGDRGQGTGDPGLQPHAPASSSSRRRSWAPVVGMGSAQI